MLKTIVIATGLLAATGTAMADRLPAPPTKVYQASTAPTCSPVTLQVYFQNGATLLNDSARRSISAAGDQLRGCALAGVKLVAVSADGRSADESEALASQRIEIVSSELGIQGFAPARFDQQISAPEDQPEANRLMARRVEVTFAAYRPAIG